MIFDDYTHAEGCKPAEKLAKQLGRELGQQVLETKAISVEQQRQIYQIITNRGKYCLKLCSDPKVLQAEAMGLRAIAQTRSVLVPKIVIEGENGVMMSWLETTSAGEADWVKLAQDLYALHSTESSFFGFEMDGYIGKMPQSNSNTVDG